MSGLFDQITNYSPPLLTAGQVNYKGTWSAAANSPTLTSPPPATSKGDYYVVSAAGTQFGITFAVGDWIISNGTAWEKVDLTDAVSSVFGRTGAVVSANGDYTASQVTNVPAGTISSTNVQDAINELSADIATAQNVLDAYVTNDEAIAITKGQVVYAFGATGNRMSVKLANNSADATSAKTVGVVLDSSIAAGNPGYIRMVGVVDGLNLGAYNDGDTLYLGATAGSVTSTKPYAPNHLVYVGIVERANNGNGQLYVRVQNGYELDEIHDVQITSAPASGALLVRDATNSLWKAARLTAGTNIAITNADASVTVGITGTIAGTNGGTGVNNGANTITIAGNVTHAGAFTQSFTATANTSLTLPVTGTLATLAGSEALSNKTITASSFSGTSGVFTSVGVSGTVTDLFTVTTTASGRTAYFKNNTAYALVDITSSGTNQSSYLNLVPSGTGSGVIQLNGSDKLTISSTGLAVTGALNATSNITSTATNPYFVGSSATAGTIYYGSTGAASSVQTLVNNTQITTVSSTGLAVTGGLSTTGSVTATAGFVIGNDNSFLYDSGTGAVTLRLGASGPYGSFLTNSGDFMVDGAGGTLLLGAAGTRVATITSTGLAVTGNTKSTFPGSTGGSSGYGFWAQDSTDASGAGFAGFAKASGTVIGSITRVTTTDAVVYNTTSDGRLKENLRDFTDSGRLIDSLKPRVFDWKNSDENGKNVVGFVAQEEHAADPIFAHIGAVSVGDEDPETITKQWQRSDSALIPILVAELKNVRQRLAALETK